MDLAALFTALAHARTQAKNVEKDKKNSFHGYKYASAEAVVAEGGLLLSENGLHLLPIATHVDPAMYDAPAPAGKKKARRGEDGEELEGGASPAGTVKILYLRRKYLLTHSSGASLQMEQDWAIVPESGRPMDKAVAGAVTASLGYFVRDLLLLPRVDEADDLDAPRRDEVRRETRQEARPEPRPEPRKEEPAKEVHKEEPRKEAPAKEVPAKEEPKSKAKPANLQEAIIAEVTDRLAVFQRDCPPPKPAEVEKMISDLTGKAPSQMSGAEASAILEKLKATTDSRLAELFTTSIVPF
jgi:hypothetical protein